MSSSTTFRRSSTAITGDFASSSQLRPESRVIGNINEDPFNDPLPLPKFRLHSVSSGGSSSDRSSKSYIRPYFRSRRVAKESIEKPWLEKPKSKWPTILPCAGLLGGLALIALQMYLGWASVKINKYCLVMEDSFKGPTLNTSLWNQEVQLGGFG